MKLNTLITMTEKSAWNAVMRKVWRAQMKVNAAERIPNPVLQERTRHKR